MVRTHQSLVQEWQDRARSGQAEARRAIAEMLTPSGNDFSIQCLTMYNGHNLFLISCFHF